MPIPDDEAAIAKAQADGRTTSTRQWMKCIDHEVPVSVAVDMVSQRIFTMTAAGLFTVFDLATFDIMFTKDFHKQSQNIIAFQHSNKVLLVFDSDILVVDANLKNGGYIELKEYELKLNKISDAKLNTSENLLGVSSTTGSTPEVSLYETEKGFEKLTTFYGFKSPIKYIDFSTDNYYLQCEDINGEVSLFEIESSRLINMSAVDFDLEWLGEGLRTYPRLAKIRDQYNDQNKILNIIKVPNKPIIAIGDEIGTIRFFNHPNEDNDAYYQCYADHLYNLTKCVFTHD